MFQKKNTKVTQNFTQMLVQFYHKKLKKEKETKPKVSKKNKIIKIRAEIKPRLENNKIQ